MNKRFLFIVTGGLLLSCFAALMIGCSSKTAEPIVILDNYFNHEVKSGQTFHYLWSDQANSGFSEWGKIFNQKGVTTDTLQQAPNLSALDKAAIYIIVDPDTKAETQQPNYIENADIKTLTSWVENGGVLVLMANDSGNCEFTHLNALAKNSGLHFNEVRGSHVVGKKWDMGAFTKLAATPFSQLHKIYMKDASTLTLSGEARPLLEKNGSVFMAVSPKGRGYVVAVTDPWIYNEYIGHKYLPDDFENHKAAEIFTDYLLQLADE